MEHSETYYKSIEIIQGIVDIIRNLFELLVGIFKFCLVMFIMTLPWIIDGVINMFLNTHWKIIADLACNFAQSVL